METRKNLFLILGEWWAAREKRARPSGMTSRVIRWCLPNGGTLLIVLALVLTANVWARPLAAPNTAYGPAATTVNYQGRLHDAAGNPLSDTYTLSFTLYDAMTGGNVVWGPENHVGVVVTDGLFDVGLGSVIPGGIPTTVWNGDRYLEVAVEGQPLSPRELIRSVPIAGMALTVPDGSLTAEKFAPGAVEKVNILRRNDDISDQADRVIVTGWGYMQGNGSSSMSEPLDFGVTFTEAPIVLTNILGSTATQPSAINDFSGFWSDEKVAAVIPIDISATGFLVNFTRNTGTFGSGYYGYSWIAIGTVD